MNSSHPENNLFYFLAMIQITLMLAAAVIIYKMININGIIFSAGSFIIPLAHVCLDIICERYGLKMAKKVIIASLFCQFMFAVICKLLIILPSPDSWHYQPAYDQVLGRLDRIFIGSFVGTLLGSFLNAKIISRWKILIKGRKFWLRSIGASAMGQFIFTIITLSYDLYGIQPYNTILSAIFTSYTIKLIFTPIAAIPAAIIVLILKKYEKIPNYAFSFNPFKNEK